VRLDTKVIHCLLLTSSMDEPEVRQDVEA
jgi:hypothetical protein